MSVACRGGGRDDTTRRAAWRAVVRRWSTVAAASDIVLLALIVARRTLRAMADGLRPAPAGLRGSPAIRRTPAHWFGTDSLGRDHLHPLALRDPHRSRHRLLDHLRAHGDGRACSAPGQGLRRGWFDAVLMRVIDTALAFPVSGAHHRHPRDPGAGHPEHLHRGVPRGLDHVRAARPRRNAGGGRQGLCARRAHAGLSGLRASCCGTRCRTSSGRRSCSRCPTSC